MRISNSLGITFLPFTLLVACAGEVEGEPDSNTEAQSGAEQPADDDEQPADERADEDPADQPVDAIGGEVCETEGDTRACTTDSGEAGMALCKRNYDDNETPLSFSACGVVDCTPGEVKSCGLDEEFEGLTTSCRLDDGRWTWGSEDCNTPLVLSFDNDAVEFTQAAGWFDLVGAGLSVNHDWVSAKTPWLVLDRNDNGGVDDGSELFGSMTVLASGARAKNGFLALAELDTDGDGRISGSDAEFSRLALWHDRNQDRQSSADELSPLTQSSVTALSLDYTRRPSCSGSACEVERAGFEYKDAAGNTRRGTTIDVHFKTY